LVNVGDTGVKHMHPLIKTLIFTVLVPGTVAVFVPQSMARVPAEPSSWLGAIGVLAGVVGALIYLRCAWDFAWTGQASTRRRPWW
jgi:protein-S-isoprenylcysteine O-methyltransferase Ste14